MSGWIRPKRSRRSAPRELSDTPPALPPTRKPWSQELDFSPPPTQSPPPDSQLDGSYWSSPVTRPPVRRRVALDEQERAILKRYRRDAEDVDDVDDEGDARQVLAPASQTSTRRGRGGAVAPWDGRQADDIVEEEEEEEHEHEHELHESIVEDGPDAHAAVGVGVAEDEEDIVSSSQHTPGVPARVAPSVAASRFSRFQVEPRRGDAQQYRLVQADAEPEPVVAMRDFRQQLLLPSSAPRTRWSELYQAAVAKASADARGWIVYALDASTVVFANDVHGDSPSLLALVGGGQPPLGVALHVVTSAGAVCSCVRTSSALLVCRMCVLAPHSSGERLESARVADLLRGRTHIDAPVSVAADFDWITVVPALARSQSTSQMRARTDAAPVVESDSLSVSPLLDAHSQQPGHWLGVDPRGYGFVCVCVWVWLTLSAQERSRAQDCCFARSAPLEQPHKCLAHLAQPHSNSVFRPSLWLCGARMVRGGLATCNTHVGRRTGGRRCVVSVCEFRFDNSIFCSQWR